MAEGLNLGKQVGPLPLGAWIAVVGGGLAIGWYFSKGSAKAADDTKVPLTEPGVGQGGGQFIYEPPTEVETPSSEPTTNSAWARRAIDWLISEGKDPSKATEAINKFITGQNRSLEEQAMINLALVKYGSPPEGVPSPPNPLPQIPIPVPPRPPSPPVKLPKAWEYYTIRKGDTPARIMARYPSSGITSWFYVYAANDRVGLRPDGSPGVMANPYDLRPGVILLVPNKVSGLVGNIPKTVIGPIRYYTAVKGDTLTTIGKKFHVHPWSIYTANDVVGMRADGSRGFLRAFSVKPNDRLIIPYG